MSSQTSETSVDKQEENQEPLKMRVVTPILNPVSKRMVDLTSEPSTLGIMVLPASTSLEISSKKICELCNKYSEK